jgi:hypothetical protein
MDALTTRLTSSLVLQQNAAVAAARAIQLDGAPSSSRAGAEAGAILEAVALAGSDAEEEQQADTDTETYTDTDTEADAEAEAGAEAEAIAAAAGAAGGSSGQFARLPLASFPGVCLAAVHAAVSVCTLG